MNRLSCVFVALLLASASSSAALIGDYNSSTGALNFSYDGAEGTLAGIRIDSVNGQLISGEATDLDGSVTGPLSVINDQAPNFIEWGNLVGITFDDASAGAVLPSGLSQADLDIGYLLRYRSLADPTSDIVGDLISDTVCLCPIPFPAKIDLGNIVAAGGLIEDAITFAGGAPTSAEFSNQSIPNLFFANIDGSSVDIGVDLALATTLPAGTAARADLTIGGAGGPFEFEVLAVVPEPASISIAGVVLVGILGTNRRSSRNA